MSSSGDVKPHCRYTPLLTHQNVTGFRIVHIIIHSVTNNKKEGTFTRAAAKSRTISNHFSCDTTGKEDASVDSVSTRAFCFSACCANGRTKKSELAPYPTTPADASKKWIAGARIYE